ncbi:MAG: YIP1 family protein [Phycisphaerales bacterium JB039]
MRCKTCDYALWNLRDRTCPECGRNFSPSEYEFVPGSVRYLCPHCGQQYYGTDQSGHLVPRAFDCVKCGVHIHMDHMVLLPAEGYSDAQTMQATNPWLTPGVSLPRRWLSTVKMAMFQPGQLIEGTPPESSRRAAWGFALLTQGSVALVGVALWLMMMMLMSTVGGAGMGAGAAIGMALLGAVMGVLFALIGFFLSAFLWAAAAHFILLLGGGTERGFVRTLQCVLYSSGANVLMIIPCANYFAWIWWVVSCAIMLKQGHRIGGLRAATAAIIAPLVFVIAFVGLYVGVVFMAVTTARGAAAGAAAAQAQFTPSGATAAMTSALLDHAADVGAWPDHAARLLDDGLAADDFAGAISPTNPADITAAGEPLTQLQQLPRAARSAAIDAIVEQLPPDLVAHRVGDFVFTYHGIAPEGADGRLWLVIESPPSNPLLPPAQILVGQADGGAASYPTADFPGALERQNTIRAAHDLAPLWHPDYVQEERPQTARDPG